MHAFIHCGYCWCMLYYLARSAAESRHCRLYVLLLFFYFLFSTICVTAIISKSTGLIFATFSGLAKLWLQMISLKFFFDTPGDVSMANCQLVFVGFDRRWLVMQQGGLTLGIVLRLISCFLYCIILFYCHFLCGPRIFVATYCYYC